MTALSVRESIGRASTQDTFHARVAAREFMSSGGLNFDPTELPSFVYVDMTMDRHVKECWEAVLPWTKEDEAEVNRLCDLLIGPFRGAFNTFDGYMEAVEKIRSTPVDEYGPAVNEKLAVPNLVIETAKVIVAAETTTVVEAVTQTVGVTEVEVVEVKPTLQKQFEASTKHIVVPDFSTMKNRRTEEEQMQQNEVKELMRKLGLKA